MTNRQLEFVLKMRDEASAKWDSFKSKMSSGASGLASMLGGLGGLLGAIGVEEFVRKSIEASNESEEATSRLVGALKSAKIYSDELLKQMQDLGGEFQKTTRFEDDAITSAQALLVAYTGLAGTALEPLIRATANYAIAQNTGIEEAAKLIGKSVQSGASMRGLAVDYGNAATPMERAAVLQEILNKRFGSFVEEDAKNASTVIKQVGNSWGDFMETTGDSLKELVVALSPILQWTLKALQGIVYFIAVGVAQVLNLVASIGGHLAWILEKVGLESEAKVKWYKEQAQKAADAAAEYLHKGYQAWGMEADGAKTSISAVGEAAGDTGNKAVEAAGKIKLSFGKMKALEPTFISQEQEQRFQRMVELADRMTNILRQPKSVRQSLIQESFAAQDKERQTLQTIKGPDVVDSSAFFQLTEFERKYIEMTDVSARSGEILWSSFDSGISGMVKGMIDGTVTMGDAFSVMTQKIIEDLLAMVAKAIILKAIMAAFGAVTGGIGSAAMEGANESGALNKRAFAGASLAGAGNMNVTIQAVDASSFQSFLAKTTNRATLVGAIRDAVGKGKLK